MKKLVVLFFFGSALLTQAQDKGQQVLELSKAKFQWMIHDRLDSLAPMLDERLKFIHSDGWIQSRQEFLDDIKSQKLNYQNIETTDMEARVYGTSAVVTGRGKFEGTNTGKTFSVNLLFTEVYYLKGHTWLLVSRHANKL